MQLNAGNINLLYAGAVLRKTRAETTQQIAVPHGIPCISCDTTNLQMGLGDPKKSEAQLLATKWEFTNNICN
jgi:hypothetical protein